MSITGNPNPQVSYLGHVFVVGLDGEAATCEACQTKVSARQAQEGTLMLEPCPQTREGKALVEAMERQQQAVAASQAKLDAPAIAVPEGWEGTDAEAIGLAVAGAVAGVLAERDKAVAMLAEMLEAWPQTSWAQDTDIKERATQLLEELGGAPEAKP